MNEVWVIAEQRLGKLQDVSLELLCKGAELAQKLGVKLAAVLLGDGTQGLAEELIRYGADRVYSADDPRLRLYQSELYADLISDTIRQHEPQIVLMGATSIGRDMAPTIAAKLQTGLTAHCVELDIIDRESGNPKLAQVVPGWGGNMMVNICCPEKRPQMASVRPGVMPKCEPAERNGDVVKIKVDVRKEPRSETLEMVEEKAAGAGLQEAEVVVAGCWGLFSAGGFKPVEEIAQVLGGAIAGTRPAVDAGWVSEQRMIGQSGNTVAPKLFVSIGASGAPQYTTGFARAKVVLSIDGNPDAPIFDVSDIGLVGDVNDILPALVSELKESGFHV